MWDTNTVMYVIVSQLGIASLEGIRAAYGKIYSIVYPHLLVIAWKRLAIGSIGNVQGFQGSICSTCVRELLPSNLFKLQWILIAFYKYSFFYLQKNKSTV